MEIFPGKEQRLLLWKMARKETQDIFLGLNDLRTWSHPTGIVRNCGLNISTLRGWLLTKAQSEDFLWMRFQPSKFEKACVVNLINCYSYCVYTNDQAKEKWSILKHKDSLREKKKLCFNGNHNVQLWVLNFSVVNCLQNFVLRMCLWMPYRSQHLIIFPEMFSLQTTFFAWFHSSKVLAFENLCNWFMICCML